MVFKYQRKIKPKPLPPILQTTDGQFFIVANPLLILSQAPSTPSTTNSTLTTTITEVFDDFSSSSTNEIETTQTCQSETVNEFNECDQIKQAIPCSTSSVVENFHSTENRLLNNETNSTPPSFSNSENTIIEVSESELEITQVDYEILKDQLVVSNSKDSKSTEPLNRFQCSFCSRTFLKKQIYNAHLVAHSDERPFPCAFCPLAFKMKTAAFRHELHQHNGGKGYSCDHNGCGILFLDKKDLYHHRHQVHLGKKLFECSHCDKVFTSRFARSSHLKGIKKEAKFACEKCDKRFRFPAELKRHMWTHTGEKPFPCERCGKKYRMKYNLDIHKLTSCPVAEVILPEESGDKRKRRGRHSTKSASIDNSPRPYQCPHCSKGFKRKSNLRSHLIAHVTERPYSCEFCGKRFKTADYVKVHHKIKHNHGFGFGCKTCRDSTSGLAAFATKQELESHRKLVHGEKPPVQCDQCGRYFSKRSNMRAHLESGACERVKLQDNEPETSNDSKPEEESESINTKTDVILESNPEESEVIIVDNIDNDF